MKILWKWIMTGGTFILGNQHVNFILIQSLLQLLMIVAAANYPGLNRLQTRCSLRKYAKNMPGHSLKLKLTPENTGVGAIKKHIDFWLKYSSTRSGNISWHSNYMQLLLLLCVAVSYQACDRRLCLLSTKSRILLSPQAWDLDLGMTWSSA